MTWTTMPLKRVFVSNTAGLWGEEAGVGTIDALCVRVADFDYSNLRVTSRAGTFRSYGESDVENRRLKPGDILIEKSGGGERTPVGRAVRFELTLDTPAVTSNFVGSLRTARGQDSRYWTFVLASDYAVRGTVPYIKQNTGIQNLDLRAYLSRRVVVPPTSQQHAIADYLDHETAEVDAFIADLQSMKQLTHERRESERARILTNASEDASTGRRVPWADGLYTPYAVQNIRRVAEMKTGHTPSRDQVAYWENVEIPWFTLADVWQLRRGAKFISETKESISVIGVANSAAEVLPAGTVVLSRTASVGFTGIMQTPMATSQDYWNWVCGPRMLSEYLWHQFRAMRQQFSKLMSGSTHKTIYQADAAGLRVVVPPIEQQKRALAMLEADDKHFQELVQDAEQAIKLATERRVALISDAVTGQIDVTKRQRPVAEQLEEEVLQKP